MVDADLFYETMANKTVLPYQLLAKKHRTNIVDYMAALSIHSKPGNFRKVSLMCTIAPTCRDVQMIEKMIMAGMNIARLNLSYCNREWLVETIQLIRQAEENLNIRYGLPVVVAIALDIRGPEVRTGLLDGDVDVQVYKGDALKLTTDKAYMNKGNNNTIYIDYDNILKYVQPEDRIYINDGQVPLLVTGIHGSNIITTVERDGTVSSSRGVFLPGIKNDLPPLSKTDREDIECAVRNGINFVLASYVRSAADVQAVKEAVGSHSKAVKIIAKLESYLSIVHLDAIMNVADGILINRKDLGIEIPSEKIFLLQKSIIAKCNLRGKCVICGKTMMDSMGKVIVPTRAESVDIANIVMDGADGLHVNETATGSYPLETIRMVSRICIEAESSMHEVPRFRDLAAYINVNDVMHITARAAVEAAYNTNASAIIAMVVTGAMAYALSKFKPRMPIIAIVTDKQVARYLVCYRAVFSTVYPDAVHDKYTPEENWVYFLQDRLNYGILIGQIHGFIKSGDPVVLVHGSSPIASLTDTMRIEYVSDIVKPICY